MHLTTYCCCIRSEAWPKCSLWATTRDCPYGPTEIQSLWATTRDCPYGPTEIQSLWATTGDCPYGPTGADSQQNILRNVERAGSLAL